MTCPRLVSYQCPMCQRLLERIGVTADAEHGECPLFQCDKCVIDWEVEGETFPAAYTFYVIPTGQPFELRDDLC